MAKLPNIIEKDRSMWKVVRFAFSASLKASKKYSILRYSFAIIRNTVMFVEFGALGIVVNEFLTLGADGVRMGVIIGAFALIVVSSFIPSVLSSFQDMISNIQSNDLARYLQKLTFDRMAIIDIGTIEQPEFQNILEIAHTRGWGGIYNIISIITNSLGNIIALLIASISLMVISPLVLIVILISVLPTYILERKNAERSGELWKSSSESRRMWLAKTNPVYGKNGLIELKNFSLVSVFLDGWTRLIGVFHNESKALYLKTSTNEVLSALLLTLGYGIGFFLIINKVFIGGLLVGSLVYTFAVISRFQSALQSLFENFGRAAEHKKNLNSLLDLFEMEPLIVSGARKISPQDFESLEIRDVSFSYPGSERIVTENLSLMIKRGQNLAVVGLNGAGKTTLMKLIMRVYDPTQGEVLLNGINLKEYDLESWRMCLGIMMQDYSTYSEETIAHNIMLGDVSRPEDLELAQRSAEESTAHEFIMELPNGYNQLVGTEFKGGIELSKGQKQKLVLARVFYRNAPIMILDEPTAAVDALSEDVIFKSLRNRHEGQTRIIISHKFSNVRDADNIILIEHGKIIEEGNHEQLMNMKDGRYKGLFDLQAEGYR